MEPKDPWGEGEGDKAPSITCCATSMPRAAPGAATTSPGIAIKSGGRRTTAPVASRLRAHAARSPPPPAPPSLQALCLGVLALHLEELVGCGEDVMPHLPADAKASLIAAARRRRRLTDAALLLLVDPDHASLTVRGAAPGVTGAGVLAAARKRGPAWRHLDLRGVPLRPRLLAALAEVCPGLEVLRFGGFYGVDEEEALAEALLGVLPRLERTPAEGVADDWEAAAEAPAATGIGRFMHLKCVVWPEMPHETKRLCEAAAPAVAINPTSAAAVGRRLPPCCLADTDLDAAALAGVAGQEAWEVEGERGAGGAAPPPPPPLHIAERFRLAFEAQDRRLRKRDRWLWRKATREVLESSGGERAIRFWEYDF